MTTIKKQDFITQFTSTDSNAELDTQDLKEAGIDSKTIVKIDINQDGKINGNRELGRLFHAIDKFDNNGLPDSIETRTQMRMGSVPTPSGEKYDALTREFDEKRSKASMQGIIHLGMRIPSWREVAALEEGNPKTNGGVVSIEGYASDGKVQYEGKEYDLKTDAGLNAYRYVLTRPPDNMSKDQAQKFIDTLKNVKNESRDEMAQLGITFYRTGEGKLPLNRLVLSGHGRAGEIFGDDPNPGSFFLTDVENLAKVFPKGAAKIEHVAVAACFCAGDHSFTTLRSAFPNLKSAFAYNEWSPTAESNAPKHLKKWESMTDGDDPSTVDPPYRKTATWNTVDGIQGLPKMSLAEAEEDVNFYENVVNVSKSRKDEAYASNLNRLYASILNLLQHPDISPARKVEVEARMREVYDLRYPNQQSTNRAPSSTPSR